jgi:hypothetical protein
LLKTPENLDKERDEKSRWEEALALNQSLATASSMKEDLRQFWVQPGKVFATAFPGPPHLIFGRFSWLRPS